MSETEDTTLVEDLLRKEPVKFVCGTDPVVAPESATVVEVLELLWDRQVSCVVLTADDPDADDPDADDDPGRDPVGAAGRSKGCIPVGIFTERDFLDRMAALSGGEWLDVKYNPIRAHMTKRPQVLPAETCLDEAIQMMTVHGYRHLPIVDEYGKLCGVLCARDVIEFLAEHFPGEIYNQPPATQPRSRFDSREGG